MLGSKVSCTSVSLAETSRKKRHVRPEILLHVGTPFTTQQAALQSESDAVTVLYSALESILPRPEGIGLNEVWEGSDGVQPSEKQASPILSIRTRKIASLIPSERDDA
jgi:hypothetical protein